MNTAIHAGLYGQYMPHERIPLHFLLASQSTSLSSNQYLSTSITSPTPAPPPHSQWQWSELKLYFFLYHFLVSPPTRSVSSFRPLQNAWEHYCWVLAVLTTLYLPGNIVSFFLLSNLLNFWRLTPSPLRLSLPLPCLFCPYQPFISCLCCFVNPSLFLSFFLTVIQMPVKPLDLKLDSLSWNDVTELHLHHSQKMDIK